MLFRISSIFALVFCLFIVYGYSQTKDKNLVIAHFDDQKITLEDFEKAYAKSGSGSEDVEKDSLSQLKDFQARVRPFDHQRAGRLCGGL